VRFGYLLFGSKQEAAAALRVLPGLFFRGTELHFAKANALSGESQM